MIIRRIRFIWCIHHLFYAKNTRRPWKIRSTHVWQIYGEIGIYSLEKRTSLCINLMFLLCFSLSLADSICEAHSYFNWFWLDVGFAHICTWWIYIQSTIQSELQHTHLKTMQSKLISWCMGTDLLYLMFFKVYSYSLSTAYKTRRFVEDHISSETANEYKIFNFIIRFKGHIVGLY